MSKYLLFMMDVHTYFIKTKRFIDKYWIKIRFPVILLLILILIFVYTNFVLELVYRLIWFIIIISILLWLLRTYYFLYYFSILNVWMESKLIFLYKLRCSKFAFVPFYIRYFVMIFFSLLDRLLKYYYVHPYEGKLSEVIDASKRTANRVLIYQLLMFHLIFPIYIFLKFYELVLKMLKILKGKLIIFKFKKNLFYLGFVLGSFRSLQVFADEDLFHNQILNNEFLSKLSDEEVYKLLLEALNECNSRDIQPIVTEIRPDGKEIEWHFINDESVKEYKNDSYYDGLYNGYMFGMFAGLSIWLIAKIVKNYI